MSGYKRRLFPKNSVDKYDDMTAVMRVDARELPLPDESVDLIVTSPPYFALRSYRDAGEHYDEQLGSEATPQEFVDNLSACMVEWRRVLKPSGSVWVNLGDKYAGSGGHNNASIGVDPSRGPSSYNKASGIARPKSLLGLPWRFAIAQIDAGWILRAEVIWSKPNGLPESVTDRVRRSHEQWFHFTKEPRYYSAVDEIREPQKYLNHPQIGSDARGTRWNDPGESVGHKGRPSVRQINPLGRVPGSVWTVPTEPLIVPDAVRELRDLPDHFAAFPQEWPRRIITGWSPSGICDECGEGRRSVTSVTQEQLGTKSGGRTVADGINPEGHDGGWDGKGYPITRSSTTITGESCACPSPTAPTRPAIVLDPFGGTGTVAGVARTLGRFGISNDLSADYNRLAIWRIWESEHFEKSHQKWLDAKAVGSMSPAETYLTSFDGIGKVSARAIIDAVGNPFILGKDVTLAKGVGKKTVEKMMDELDMLGSWVSVDGEEIYE